MLLVYQESKTGTRERIVQQKVTSKIKQKIFTKIPFLYHMTAGFGKICAVC